MYWVLSWGGGGTISSCPKHSDKYWDHCAPSTSIGSFKRSLHPTLEPETPLYSNHAEPKMFPRTTRDGHSQGNVVRGFLLCPHFLHKALSERPMTWGSILIYSGQLIIFYKSALFPIEGHWVPRQFLWRSFPSGCSSPIFGALLYQPHRNLKPTSASWEGMILQIVVQL